MADRGRPSIFSEELATRICERLAAGESLIGICNSDDNMPAESTVRLWALEDRDGFSAKYTRAREIGYLHMGDEMLEIADTTQEGVVVKESEKGTETRSGDMIEHRKLRVETRKWTLARMLPKVYGDRQTHEVELSANNRLLQLIEAGMARAAQR